MRDTFTLEGVDFEKSSSNWHRYDQFRGFRQREFI
jgi:hypothetical protein